MYAITGAFGQTGLAVTQALLDAGQSVRMIVRRDDEQAKLWRIKGAEVVIADLTDTSELARAFENVESAYLMNPPAYFVPDLFTQARLVHTSLINAANTAGVPNAVALSSVGAQHAAGTGNISTTHDFELQLASFTGHITVLRAANFMENWAWSLPAVMEQSKLPSMFRPIQRALPMVSALDIGHTVAALLIEKASTRRVVELHGPHDYSPQHAAHDFGRLLGRPIEPFEESDTEWSAAMTSKGFPKVTVSAFVEMFAGFNSGLIAFEGTHETRRGTTPLYDALSAILTK